MPKPWNWSFDPGPRSRSPKTTSSNCIATCSDTAKRAHHRGKYKTQPNNVAAFDETGKQVGIVFETATPFDTPRQMSELVAWVSEAFSSRRLHPLLAITIFTVVLLEIHPFQERKRSAKPRPGDSPVAPRGLLLRPVQLSRKRDRTEQRRLLSLASPDLSSEPYR